MFEKRRYQDRAVENFKTWIVGDRTLATVILPTGTGKTFVATQCIGTQDNLKILWSVHRSELVDQAYNTLLSIIPGKKITKEIAEYKASSDSDIIVGSVQTLARQRKNLNDFVPDLIVIDEYHHYSAGNVQYDGLLKRWPGAKVLGLTATPSRTGEVLPLGEILIQMDIGTAVEKKYLVPPIHQVIDTQVSLAHVKTSMGDFATKELSRTVNTSDRNTLIVNKIIELVSQGRQGIFFGVDVEHSQTIYGLLKDKVRAAEVYGSTPTDDRARMMQSVHDKEIDVLVNNLVLAEGFDAPHLSFVVIGRPTRSLNLQTQMVGRGLRTHSGKTDCIVVDVYDKIKSSQNRVSFADVAVAGDLNGSKKRSAQILEQTLDGKRKFFINKNRWQTDDEEFSLSTWKLDDYQWICTWTVDKKIPRTQTKYKRVQLSSIDIKQYIDRQVYSSHGTGVVVDSVDSDLMVEFDHGERKLINPTLLQIDQPYQIKTTDFDILKQAKLFYICMPDPAQPGRILSFIKQNNNLLLCLDQHLDYNDIDQYMQSEARADGVLNLVRVDAKWKKNAASEKQINMIRSKQYNRDLDTSSLTKGAASAIIEQTNWSDIVSRMFGTDSKEKLIGYDATLDDV